ncbi:hypothetical protein ACI7RC_18930 [Brevibacillus sp. B_LB10_24]|uniref:hypothetical protein n=1 Tax=Brevibacillus sp. B_LB10_24 TaxID=3380645 RepID=UPI0038BA22A0
MWIIIGILAAAIAIGFIEVPSLWKSGQKRELCVFSFLLLIGTGLGIAKTLQIHIPNPLDWMAVIYKPFSDFLFGILK